MRTSVIIDYNCFDFKKPENTKFIFLRKIIDLSRKKHKQEINSLNSNSILYQINIDIMWKFPVFLEIFRNIETQWIIPKNQVSICTNRGTVPI